MEQMKPMRPMKPMQPMQPMQEMKPMKPMAPMPQMDSQPADWWPAAQSLRRCRTGPADEETRVAAPAS